MPQRSESIKVRMGKNGNWHCSQNFDIFAMKMTYLSTLLSFLLPSHFTAQSEAFEMSYHFLIFLS